MYGVELNRVQIHSYCSSNIAKVRRILFGMCLKDDCVCLMYAVLPSGLIFIVCAYTHSQTDTND